MAGKSFTAALAGRHSADIVGLVGARALDAARLALAAQGAFVVVLGHNMGRELVGAVDDKEQLVAVVAAGGDTGAAADIRRVVVLLLLRVVHVGAGAAKRGAAVAALVVLPGDVAGRDAACVLAARGRDAGGVVSSLAVGGDEGSEEADGSDELHVGRYLEAKCVTDLNIK